MLTTEEAERYEDMQKSGLPISVNTMSVKKAAEMVGLTFAAISKQKATKPGVVEEGKITWWIVGSMIMLYRPSVLIVARKKGWIEEIK